MNFITDIIKVRTMLNCCFTDTDSLVYEIETDDVYEDFCTDKNLFDFSDYPLDSNIFDPVNKKVKMVKKIKKKAKRVNTDVVLRIRQRIC